MSPPLTSPQQFECLSPTDAVAENQKAGAGRPDVELNYSPVQLLCGDRVLSEADNWYVPSRLTPEMNRLLETTDTPFGKAVQALEPFRQTFDVRLLWSPLPDGWERQANTRPPCATTGPLTIPAALF